MPINVVCNSCQAKFQLKDEFAWRKWKCSNCSAIIEVPNSFWANKETEKVSSVGEDQLSQNQKQEKNNGVFSHNIYGIKQKKIAINEKYFIKDKDNNDLLFSLREAYGVQWETSYYKRRLYYSLTFEKICNSR